MRITPMMPYNCTVTVGTDWAAQCLDLGTRLEAEGNLTGALTHYETAALHAPYIAAPQFKIGTIHLTEGRLVKAAAAYRRAIALTPDYLDAHLNLGAVLHRQGKLSDAVTCYKQALAINPDSPNLSYNLGVALYEMGDPSEAVAQYERALQLGAMDAGIYYQLAIALQQLGKCAEAVEQCERSVALEPGFAPAHLALGNLLADRGDVDAAIARYRRALVLNPVFAEAHLALGDAALKQKDPAEAIRCYERALTLKPDDPATHYHLGIALEKTNQDEAVARYERALALKPDFARVHCALGRILRDRRELGRALARFERAIALQPNLAEAYLGLAVTLDLQGQFGEATTRYRKAISVGPDWAEAHAAFATILLRQGNLAPGWREYEWRWKLEGPTFRPHRCTQPRWGGEPLDGERILLHAEQGLGDTIQFVRYAPLVAALGGQVVLEVPGALRDLLSTMPGIEAVLSPDEPLSDIRWQCPLMSLPLVFGTELTTIPAAVPYLSADASRAGAWALRLKGDGLRVGVSWAGNPAHQRDRERSIDVTTWERLASIPGVRFFSLQQGARGLAHVTPPFGLPLTDLAPELVDFADTAAAIAALDLIITVDTAVAHLAGALGKPVWILLPYTPDWRWLLERDDNPWYPTARLFRQPRPGMWGPVLAQVACELGRSGRGL